VRFSYVLAGFGSRFLAALIDTVIQTIMVFLLFLALALLAAHFPAVGERGTVMFVIIAAGNFFIWIGYFVLFEMLWNGQSPGKRPAGLRVIRDDGTPITLTESLLRNLLRVVDFLPAYYLVGILSILLSKRSKRIGDFAAGTVVVMEREEEEPEVPVLPAQGATDPRVMTLVPLVARLSQQEMDTLEHFLERRDEVQPQTRARLAQRLATSLRASLGPTLPAGLPDEPEDLLQLVYLAVLQRRQNL